MKMPLQPTNRGSTVLFVKSWLLGALATHTGTDVQWRSENRSVAEEELGCSLWWHERECVFVGYNACCAALSKCQIFRDSLELKLWFPKSRWSRMLVLSAPTLLQLWYSPWSDLKIDFDTLSQSVDIPAVVTHQDSENAVEDQDRAHSPPSPSCSVGTNYGGGLVFNFRSLQSHTLQLPLQRSRRNLCCRTSRLQVATKPSSFTQHVPVSSLCFTLAMVHDHEDSVEYAKPAQLWRHHAILQDLIEYYLTYYVHYT